MFDVVVSLGYRCSTAQHLRRMMIHSGTTPFDWIISPNRGAVEAIESDFEGMLQPERLELQADRVIDHCFGFAYVHDYPIRADYLSDQEDVLRRQQQLVERFRRLLASDAQVLFVREEAADVVDPGAGRRLVEALARRRPRSSFHLLFLTEANVSIFTAGENITLGQMPKDSWDNPGEWDSVFTALHERRPINAYYPALVRAVGAMPAAVRRSAQQLIGNSRRRILQLLP